MKKSDEVGANIARIRNIRGMTQHQLAALANVGRDYLAHVERGKKAPTAVWVGVVAAALGVDACILYGAESEAEQIDRIAPTVRRVLAAVEFPPDIDAEPLEVLRPQVEQVGKWRHAAAYAKIVDVLPDLVDQLLVAGLRDGAPAYALLTSVLRAANTLGHKTGHYDLSLLATNYMVSAASQADDPLLLATTQYVKSAALARVGATEQAVRLTDRTISEVEPLADDETAAAVLCALHMRRAGLASTAFDADTTDTHFAEAHILGERVGDRQVLGTVVGPTNVRLFELSSAVDLGRVPKALELADETELPTGYPRERQAHFWLDKARAHLSAGDPDRAIEALANAKEAAPEYFQKSRAVKTAIRTTASQQRRASGSLRALAHYAGISD
ncbi:helix-turn-helix transcriptional regulator [Nocardia sp. NPDC023852]|uniref:helix-turn-helix domain-containing protein n=1 Tax=Nocardia sp. NPDC023852 TaxID=3154697 RepID=UPI0033C70501